MTGVTAVMIGHNNEDLLLPRLDAMMAALRHCKLDVDLVVVDNSADWSPQMQDGVDRQSGRYYWQGGANLMYGPAMNVAANEARHDRMLYVCGNHGESVDPTWPRDLLAPLADDGVAMTGCLQPTGPPEKFGFRVDLSPIHVQGGILAARTETLLAHPYPDGRCAHWYSDIYQSLRLMAAGWLLANVPTIRSVWQDEPGKGNFKYVHRGG